MRDSLYLARTCLVWWGSDLIVWQSFGAKAVLVVRVPRAGWAQHLGGLGSTGAGQSSLFRQFWTENFPDCVLPMGVELSSVVFFMVVGISSTIFYFGCVQCWSACSSFKNAALPEGYVLESIAKWWVW